MAAGAEAEQLELTAAVAINPILSSRSAACGSLPTSSTLSKKNLSLRLINKKQLPTLEKTPRHSV
jgi:hypothetical protein